MKAQELLSQIKNLLGMENINLEKLSLENGTVLEAEAFESGKEVFILSEDEKIALPVGEYQLEDGRMLKVEEEGMISELFEYQEKEEKEEEEKEEKKEDDKEDDKEDMKYVTREEFKKEMDDIKMMIEKMMKDKEEMSTNLSKVVTETIEEENRLKEELSKPAAQPLKHSPENKQDLNKVQFAPNRVRGTRDRVLQKIANF